MYVCMALYSLSSQHLLIPWLWGKQSSAFVGTETAKIQLLFIRTTFFYDCNDYFSFLWSITIILFRKTFAVLVEVCNGLHNEFFTVFIIEMMFSQMCQNKQNSHKTLGLAQNKGLALSWNPTIPAKPFLLRIFVNSLIKNVLTQPC